MGKTKKTKKHFLDDNFKAYKKIRKPMPKPSRPIDDRQLDDKFDWKKIINEEY